ncbi:hypothetical protein HNQ50_001424 [Silvimonas terrae]|uniref:N-acetyltransferase domain-containing protein n=1 Tax=Silvimonas terrae TaxID=300266 RepID=A0A840REG9_9NEIS|nr:hypothetical protein [Silvimonas terrae]MBB5190702.1 hypothetical protein [Silvimonas terrae]
MKLICKREDWSEWHAQQLARSVGDDPLCDLALYRGMVEDGSANLYTFRDAQNNPVACYLLTVERYGSKREAVIVAAASVGQGLTTPVLEHIKAQCVGCDSIRAHTWRPGMVKRLKEAGFMPAETVLRWTNGK